MDKVTTRLIFGKWECSLCMKAGLPWPAVRSCSSCGTTSSNRKVVIIRSPTTFEHLLLKLSFSSWIILNDFTLHRFWNLMENLSCCGILSICAALPWDGYHCGFLYVTALRDHTILQCSLVAAIRSTINALQAQSGVESVHEVIHRMIPCNVFVVK